METHRQGNALDQIWTNLEISKARLIRIGETFYHDLILAFLPHRMLGPQQKKMAG